MSLIVLGVTGGIGAYKAVEVARGLQTRGHEVAVVMTRGARRFIAPLTFEAITRRRVITDQFAPGLNAEIEHISLATEADVLVVAPATANIIGKFANGIADDFLTSLYLATRAPVVLAPAMNTNMLEHGAVRRNLETLEARGAWFVEPGEGYLACGWIGRGRLADPEDVVEAVDRVLRPRGVLSGLRVLVTAGPTYEDLDPVRYVGNRSSGRMGFAIAAEAARRGAQVMLVVGPTSVPPPGGLAELVRVRSAGEMHAAVLARVDAADAVIMAAAVADYTLAGGSHQRKIAKDAEELSLTLVRTRDILADLAARRGSASRPLLVGFAAETHDVVTKAKAKLAGKRLDLIVANDVSRADTGFEVETNAVTLISAGGEEPVPLQRKTAIAALVIDRIEQFLAATMKV